MTRTNLASWISATLLCAIPFSASAQLDKLFKDVIPKGDSKTEQMIRGGIKTVQGLMPIGYKEEMAIGGAVALEAVARFGGLWQNEAVEKYLATVGAAVAQTSDRPEIPYYFGILNTDEPNAFACPGGYIFVSRGLLKMVQNEAQLGGILGHEIAHVAKKHALEALRKSKLLSGVSEVTLSALDKDPKMFDQVVKATTNLILENGLGQAKELESDAVGTDYALRVGYNPTGLKIFLGLLQGVEGKTKSTLYRTHPSAGSRILKLSTVLLRPEFKGTSSYPLVADRLIANLSSISL